MNAARILCVDDDSRINELNKIALTRAGYDVEVAVSPDDALERFRQSSFDLVVTDLFLPSSSNSAFIANLRKLAPKLPIILTSGNHNPPAEIVQQTDAFVEKAYSIGALTTAVCEVLGRTKVRRIG